MTKRIGLFGGSFDPPHLGHQALVYAAIQELHLDEVWVIPVGLPVHRQLSGKATPKQRLSWLNTMFADEPRVHVVEWEINQPQSTPAIHTLRKFNAENPNIIPLWLMGMDSFLDMPNWVEYPKHQQLCNVAVFRRKGCDNVIKTDIKANHWQHIETDNMPLNTGHVCWLNTDLPDISATQIRRNPQAHQQDLHQDTCNAIVSCYASD